MQELTITPRARGGVSLWRYVALALILGALCLSAFSWYMGGKLAASANHPVGPPPPSLGVSDVTFQSESGTLVHGWLATGTAGRGAVLLLHGVRSDRRSMLGRAEFLHDRGYSVLLIDLQAHGESPGQQITLGHLESRDVIAAQAFLRKTFPNERVAAIGVSLGAASITLAEGRAAFDAVVLESMYPAIAEAVRDRLRLRLGAAGTLLAPLLTAQLQPRLGINVDQLRPIDRIDTLGSPLLLIHGTEDQHTLIDEARAVFARAAEPKQIWKYPAPRMSTCIATPKNSTNAVWAISLKDGCRHPTRNRFGSYSSCLAALYPCGNTSIDVKVDTNWQGWAAGWGPSQTRS